MAHTFQKRVLTRRPIHLFLGLVTLFALIGYGIAIMMGDSNRSTGLFIVQFAPLVAAFITRFTYQRNLRGFGWGWGKSRYQAAAWGLGLLLPLITFSLIWLLGFGGFNNTSFVLEARAGLAESFGMTIDAPWLIMLAVLALNATLGLVVAFGGIGEELGWRGFLVPELNKHFDFTKTSLISGVIWTVYHWPLIYFLMAPRLDIAAWPLMLITLLAGIGLSTIMAWLRLKSGSVWTAVIFHMTLNINNQGFYENLTEKTSWITHYISGEHGLMLGLVSLAFGYWFWRKRTELPPAPRVD